MIAPLKFRKKLEKEAKSRGISDLEQKLRWIDNNVKNLNLWRDFRRNPYCKENGSLVYFMGETDSEENLLGAFSVEEIAKLIERPIIKKGDTEIYETDHIPGKIIIFPDTNVWLNSSGLGILRRDPAYDIDLLTIIKEESKKGNGRSWGLYRYNGLIPEELVRGRESVRRRLAALHVRGNFTSEIEKLYDCVFDYFTERVRILSETLLTHPEWTDRRIAESAAKGESESEVYTKQVEKLRKGNNWNLVADRLLVAASYAFNLASTDNVAVVVSEDKDLEDLNKIMKNEIIPLYIARGASSLTKGVYGKIKSYFLSPEDLVSFAKRHLDSSETIWSSEDNHVHSAGIIYNPRTEEFSFSTLPKAYVRYIHGLESYRSGKQKMIATAGILGISPKEALEILIKGDPQDFSDSPIRRFVDEAPVGTFISPGSFYREQESPKDKRNY